MIGSQPANINFLTFFKTGAFNCLKPGQTKEWILEHFPHPDYLPKEPLHGNFYIWQYGNIELHFESDILYLIYSDYIHDLSGGKSLQLDKWILENPEVLTLKYVTEQLNNENINFNKRTTPIVDHTIQLFLIESEVVLTFDNADKKSANPNEYELSSFALTQKEMIPKYLKQS